MTAGRQGLANHVVAGTAILLFAACGPAEQPPAAPSIAEDAPAPVTAGDRNLVVAVTGDVRRVEETLAPYTVETGRRLSVVVGDNAEEGEYADVYIGEYFADTWGVAEANGLRPYRPAAEPAIAAQWTDPEARWVPLGIRFRSIVINENMTTAEDREQIGNYAALRDERWRGRLCLSTSRHAGNRLLVGHLISRYGEREAELIVRGWVANLAVAPYRDDSALLAAIVRGDCAVGILDSSVFARHDAAAPAAVLPLREDAATVVDIAVAAVGRHATDPDGATGLIGWLLTSDPNEYFASSRREYPLAEGAELHPAVAALPPQAPSNTPIADFGFLLEDAELLIQRARYF